MHKSSSFALSIRRLLLATVFSLLGYAENQAGAALIGCTADTNLQSSTSKIVTIDPLTGLASNPRDTGIHLVAGISVQPSTGHLFGLTTVASSSPENALIRIDPSTGAFTVVGSTGLPDIVEGDLAFNPLNGLLYGVQTGTGPGVQRTIFTISPLTGAGTVIGPTGTTGDISALAFDLSGVLYGIDTGNVGTNPAQLVVIDPGTGLITSTLTTNYHLGSAAGMTFDPATGTAFVADGSGNNSSNSLYSLDVSTGVLTMIGPVGTPAGISGLAFENVPEPSSIWLLSLAISVCRLKRIGVRLHLFSKRGSDNPTVVVH